MQPVDCHSRAFLLGFAQTPIQPCCRATMSAFTSVVPSLCDAGAILQLCRQKARPGGQANSPAWKAVYVLAICRRHGSRAVGIFEGEEASDGASAKAAAGAITMRYQQRLLVSLLMRRQRMPDGYSKDYAHPGHLFVLNDLHIIPAQPTSFAHTPY